MHIIAARFNGMKERRCSWSSGGGSIFNAIPPPTIIHSLSIIFPRRRCIRRYSPWWEHLRSLLFAPLLDAVILPRSLVLFSHCLRSLSWTFHFSIILYDLLLDALRGKEGSCPLFSRVLLMSLFWALSVSLGPSAHSYSRHRVVEITSPPNPRAIYDQTFH